MLTLLDCINRIPSIHQDILAKAKERCKPLLSYLGDLSQFNEIVIIGSGTSHTSSITATRFVEEVSGYSTQSILPNEFLGKKHFNPKAIYFFTSQSGTSTLATKALELVVKKGYKSVGCTGDEDNPIHNIAGCHVNIGCGNEEFGMRTIGYHSTVLTLMVIGLELGLAKGSISQEKYDEYYAEAEKFPASHKVIVEKAMKWFDDNKSKFLSYNAFAIYGSRANWGVALEGALKILEIAGRHISVGYEMDDGMHGPTMGFTRQTGLIILNDGKHDQELAKGLAQFGRKELSNAHVVGCHAKEKEDISFEIVSGSFYPLEFAPVVQVLAYRLAVDYGIKLLPWDEMMKEVQDIPQYFNTHDEPKKD
jgi:glucosamine 6-phosphate synthetase-like amidotransferase/phosphosugar isomerase protein